MSRSRFFFAIFSLAIFGLALCPPAGAQVYGLDQIQVAPPMRQIEPPSPNSSIQELEKTGDELRGRKAYLDSIDYYEMALKKKPNDAGLYNKIGISQLLLQRLQEARKNFESAIKSDRKFADAYNNLGVVKYIAGCKGLGRFHFLGNRDLGKAVYDYKIAIGLSPDSASFYSNLGAAYFANRKFDEASQAYGKALEIDPDIFDVTSRTGVAAQISSAEDRAHYDYLLAKLFAKMNDADHSLEYLRKAMEDGYKRVNDVYTDPEFANLRKDARFEQLMKEHPVAVSE